MEAHDGRVQRNNSQQFNTAKNHYIWAFPIASLFRDTKARIANPTPKERPRLPTHAPVLLTPIPTHVFSALFTIVLPRPTKVRPGAAQARGTLLVHDRPALLTGRTTAVRRHGWRRRRHLGVAVQPPPSLAAGAAIERGRLKRVFGPAVASR
jgi:hypothetical protein